MSLERRNHGRNHSYWIDGVKVVSITQVLNRGIPHPAYAIADVRKAARFATDNWDELAQLAEDERRAQIEDAPKKLLSAAATRGTRVHKFAEQLAAGQEVKVPDEYAGLVDAYEAFVEEWRPRELVVERPFFHRSLMYAGTPDLVADLADGGRYLLDWKTGASGIWPEHALQLAAARYAEVYLDEQGEEHPVRSLGIMLCAAIHLRADGSYELRRTESGRAAWDVFVQAKEVAAYCDTDRGDWIGDAELPPTKEEVTA